MRAVAKKLEGKHDQCVARQHGQALAEGPMYRGEATPGRRVVETRQVVMYERSAVQELERACRRVRQLRAIVATGMSNGE